MLRKSVSEKRPLRESADSPINDVKDAKVDSAKLSMDRKSVLDCFEKQICALQT